MKDFFNIISTKKNIMLTCVICLPFTISWSIKIASSTKHGFYSIVTNDTEIGSNWHIDKIDLNEAWEISTKYYGCVGIADTGIYSSHPDLQYNYNSFLSYDFINGRNSPSNDDPDHGTRTSGLIGARGNNNQGVAGVLWNTSLVSLRIDQNYGNHLENADGLISAIEYATNNNIPLINFSGGFVTYTNNPDNEAVISNTQISTLYTKISNYPGLIVCSAGNESTTLDPYTHPIYPQVLDLDNIIVVGGTDSNDSICSFSNYGEDYVDLFAPGIIGSTTACYNEAMNNVEYDTFMGTSASAPLVTGVAGMIKSINPNLTATQIKSIIMNSVDSVSGLTNKCVSGGRLNAYSAALAALPTHSSGQTFSSLQSLNTNDFHWYKINVAAGVHTFSKPYNSLLLRGDLYSDIQSTAIACGNTTMSGSFFTYSFSTSGTYYLKITNCGSTSGNYNITIN